jgi:hypothetical protein
MSNNEIVIFMTKENTHCSTNAEFEQLKAATEARAKQIADAPVRFIDRMDNPCDTFAAGANIEGMGHTDSQHIGDTLNEFIDTWFPENEA